jgi:hypothetical protein
MTEATVVIKGRNELSYAVKQAERDLKGLLRQGEVFKKLFTGGAIVAAAIAFGRLAENAELTAKKFGQASVALEDLNRKLNTATTSAKRLGAALAEETFGELGFGGQRREVIELTRQLENLKRLQRGQDGFLFTDRDRADTIRRIADVESRLKVLRENLPFGERSRAPGSRGGGQSVVLTNPTPERPVRTTTAKEELWVDTDRIILAERAWMELGDTINQSMSGIGDNLSRWSDETFDSLTQPVEMAASVWDAYAEQGARNIQNAFAEFLFDPFEDGLRGMARGFVDAIRQMLAQYLAFTAITGIGGALGNSSNPFLSSIGGFLSGARASGGPVSAGGAFLVGEQGPEIFVPRSSGQIIPNGAMGGVSVSYSIDARGADADRIMAIMPGLMKQSEQRTIARVQELIGRGRLA